METGGVDEDTKQGRQSVPVSNFQNSSEIKVEVPLCEVVSDYQQLRTMEMTEREPDVIYIDEQGSKRIIGPCLKYQSLGYATDPTAAADLLSFSFNIAQAY